MQNVSNIQMANLLKNIKVLSEVMLKISTSSSTVSSKYGTYVVKFFKLITSYVLSHSKLNETKQKKQTIN